MTIIYAQKSSAKTCVLSIEVNIIQFPEKWSVALFVFFSEHRDGRRMHAIIMLTKAINFGSLSIMALQPHAQL